MLAVERPETPKYKLCKGREGGGGRLIGWGRLLQKIRYVHLYTQIERGLCVCDWCVYVCGVQALIYFHSDMRRTELSSCYYLRVCSLILWQLL